MLLKLLIKINEKDYKYRSPQLRSITSKLIAFSYKKSNPSSDTSKYETHSTKQQISSNSANSKTTKTPILETTSNKLLKSLSIIGIDPPRK